jgi:hypothetical protein
MEQIITYDDFAIFYDADTETFYYQGVDSDDQLVELEEVEVLDADTYMQMTDEELIDYKFDYDIGGEFDDCTGYGYYKFVEN